MSFERRQLRIRALEAIGQASRVFRTRHEIWPLRVPRDPLRLSDVLRQALGPDAALIEERDLKSRSILLLEWDADGDVPAARWEAWFLALPTGINLYCDSDDEETRILASARRDAEGGGIDGFFLELLAESAGDHFGIQMSGGAPSRVRSTVVVREALVEFFVELFEVTGNEASVRDVLVTSGGPSTGEDFRDDVERWLTIVAK